MARRGFIDKEIALCIGVTEQTFNNWKKSHPLFFESLKDWKAEADAKVERSLFERANGWSCPDTKAQWVETTRIEDGKTIRDGRWEYADLVKHYPGDTTAMIFWLKNRKPSEWRDKVETEHIGEVRFKVIYEDGRSADADG